MLTLGSTYLITKNMNESITFYSKLLECEPKTRNINRWAEFHGANFCIALLNPKYDIIEINSGRDTKNKYNENYLEYKKLPIQYGNNIVLIFCVKNLNQEYQRIINLSIGEVSKILFINVVTPYYCFILKDPDGNQIEITGQYNESSG